MDADTLEATSKDERGNYLWQVHTNALSLDDPLYLPGGPQLAAHHGSTPKRYKKETSLNVFTLIVDLGLTKNHVAQFV